MSASEPAGHALPDAAYRRMALVLRIGLGVALTILISGLVAYLLAHPNETTAQALASNPILSFLSLNGLAAGLAAGSIEAYLTVGLLVLLATPILRVVSGSYYFGRHHERTMTVLTMVVFVLLVLGLLVIGPYVR